MDTKQLLTGALVVMGGFLFVIILVISLYFIYPPILGIEPTSQKKEKVTEKKKVQPIKINKDTVPVTPTVLITEQRLKQFQLDVLQRDQLKMQKDSLVKFSGKLNDSVNRILFEKRFYTDSIQKYSKNLNDTKNFTNKLLDSIFKIQKQLNLTLDKVKNVEQRIKDQEAYISKKQDSLEMKNLNEFAKIYNSANPSDVAKILEQIDERDASKILKKMSVKKAGKVLEAMKPEQAAAILLLGGSN